MLKRNTFLILVFLVAAQCSIAAPKPIVSFIKANIGDSAKVVKERAFDVMLKDAVEHTPCLAYVNLPMRDSLARKFAESKQPFTFKAMHSLCGVRYGVFFSLERYGFLMRLATKVVDSTGTVFERTDLTLLRALDSVDYHNPFEGAIVRLMKRVASAIANASDPSCPVRVDPLLPLLAGGVVMHRMDKGFGVFLSDNATRVCNVVLARIADSLQLDRRFLVIDIRSRDELFGKIGEFGILNTATPTTQEVALLSAAGIPLYLVAEIDTAEEGRKLHVYVHAFSTAATSTAPVFSVDKIIEPDLETMYSTLNAMAVDVAIHMIP